MYFFIATLAENVFTQHHLSVCLIKPSSFITFLLSFPTMHPAVSAECLNPSSKLSSPLLVPSSFLNPSLPLQL